MQDKLNLSRIEDCLLEHPDLSGLSSEEQFSMIAARAKSIVGQDRLKRELLNCREDNRPLRIKYGIDATGRELHLGHAVPLFVLRRLQKMGHHVVLLIGDFTASIGDPTGRVATRAVLNPDEIKKNASTYEEQAGKILDLSRTEVRFNSEWLETYKLRDLFKILSGLTVSSAFQRKDFRERESVTRAELLYSTLMAIDSVELKAELELGGDDQLLNFYDAERVMENEGCTPESAVTTDILLGTSGDGNKMSKSLSNFISLVEKPAEMYGKIMSIPDALMEQYFKLLTDISDEQWKDLSEAMINGGLNPKEAKMLLARVLVSDLHDRESAQIAEGEFNRRVVHKEISDDSETVSVPEKDGESWIAILKFLDPEGIPNNSAARRLLIANGVKLHFGKTTDWETVSLNSTPPKTSEGFVLKLGKRRLFKVKIEN